MMSQRHTCEFCLIRVRLNDPEICMHGDDKEHGIKIYMHMGLSHLLRRTPVPTRVKKNVIIAVGVILHVHTNRSTYM